MDPEATETLRTFFKREVCQDNKNTECRLYLSDLLKRYDECSTTGRGYDEKLVVQWLVERMQAPKIDQQDKYWVGIRLRDGAERILSFL